MFRVDDACNVYMTRGDDVSITVDIVNDDGTSYTMAAGDVLALTVRNDYDSQSIVFSASVTGTNVIAIASSATANVAPRKYVYDIQLTKASNSNKHTVVGPDGFNNPTWTILGDVTR